jgi:streptomycin 3"-adenylyltransferase
MFNISPREANVQSRQRPFLNLFKSWLARCPDAVGLIAPRALQEWLMAETGAAEEPARYAQRLAYKLAEDCRGRLRAAILHGSTALGGWMPGRSDVDVLFIVADGVTEVDLRRMTTSLVTLADDCPGCGIETSIVSEAQARDPKSPWPYLRHVVAGGATEPRIGPQPGADASDPDLVMYYAVCRAKGVSVHGAAAASLIGEVPRRLILAYLAGDLNWGLENASEAYAVLNACRAEAYLTTGQLISKLAGGELALQRAEPERAGLIGRALCQQRGQLPSRPSDPEATAFVRGVTSRLQIAARA